MCVIALSIDSAVGRLCGASMNWLCNHCNQTMLKTSKWWTISTFISVVFQSQTVFNLSQHVEHHVETWQFTTILRFGKLVVNFYEFVYIGLHHGPVTVMFRGGSFAKNHAFLYNSHCTNSLYISWPVVGSIIWTYALVHNKQFKYMHVLLMVMQFKQHI